MEIMLAVVLNGNGGGADTLQDDPSPKTWLERGVKAIVQQVENGRFGLGKDPCPGPPHAAAVDGRHFGIVYIGPQNVGRLRRSQKRLLVMRIR